MGLVERKPYTGANQRMVIAITVRVAMGSRGAVKGTHRIARVRAAPAGPDPARGRRDEATAGVLPLGTRPKMFQTGLMVPTGRPTYRLGSLRAALRALLY